MRIFCVLVITSRLYINFNGAGYSEDLMRESDIFIILDTAREDKLEVATYSFLSPRSPINYF